MAPGDPKFERWTRFAREYETADPNAVQVVMGAGPINYRSNNNWKIREEFPGWVYTPQGGGSYNSIDADGFHLTAKNNTITITDDLGTTTLVLASIDLDADPWIAVPANTGPTPTSATRLTWSYLQGGILVHIDATPERLQVSFEITENVLSGKPVTGDVIYLRINKSGVERDWSNISAVRGVQNRDTPVVWDVQPGYIRKGVATTWLLQTYYFPIVIDPAYTIASYDWMHAQWNGVGGVGAYIWAQPASYMTIQYDWIYPDKGDPYLVHDKIGMKFDLRSYPEGIWSNESFEYSLYSSNNGSTVWYMDEVPEPSGWDTNSDAQSLFLKPVQTRIFTTTGWPGASNPRILSGSDALHRVLERRAGDFVVLRLSTDEVDGYHGILYSVTYGSGYPVLKFTYTPGTRYNDLDWPMPEWDPEEIMFPATEVSTSKLVMIQMTGI